MLIKISNHLIVLIAVFTVVQVSAQDLIDSIEFQGVVKSDLGYLKRHIKIAPGQIYDADILAKDLQTLSNLYTISQVHADTMQTTKGIRVVLRIDEALTIFPIIGIGGIKDNLWFQVGVKNIHQFGRGIQWSAIYGNIDGRNNGQFTLHNPNIGRSRFGYYLNIVRWASTEPLFFNEGTVTFDYDINYLELGGSYQININQFVEVGAAYFTERYSKLAHQEIADPPGPDLLNQRKSLYKGVYSLDRRNYHSFYVEGYSERFTGQWVVTHGEAYLFNIFINDLVWFTRVGKKGNLGARLRTGLASNDETPFAPFVIDSRLNIRGVGNRIDRGTGQIILNTEYRQTFFDAGYFAGQVVGFSDLGTWRNPGGKLSDFIDRDNFRHFMGLGLRLIYKRAFDAIIRLDYGIDLYNSHQRGFVLGFGQYF